MPARCQHANTARPTRPDLARLWEFVRTKVGRRKYYYHNYFPYAKTYDGPMPERVGRVPKPPPASGMVGTEMPSWLFEADPLTWPQQFHLFRKLNYLRWRIDRALMAKPKRATKAMNADYAAGMAARDTLITSNMRLVHKAAQRIAALDRGWIVSEATAALINAVDMFDPWRGWHFSTYATVAMRQTCWRKAANERSRIDTQLDDMDPVDHREPGTEDTIPEDTRAMVAAVRSAIDRLPDERMKTVMRSRFGIDGARCTLMELGVMLGVSKERVRQIQMQAHAKMRAMLPEYE
jgi:RNA polymerase sigma factor (sigma-70 family)